MSWVLFALIATVLWALANVFDKILRTKFLKSSISLAASFGIFYSIFVFVLFLVVGDPFTIPLPHLLAALTAGIAVPYAIIPYVKSLSLEEASRVVPLWHFSAIFTLLLAVIFLNEILTSLRYIAFALILTGGILISTRRIGSIFHVSPAVALMLFSSFLIGVSDVLLKFAYSTGIFWKTFLVHEIGIAASALSLFALPKTKQNVSKMFLSRKNFFVLLLFLSTFAGFIGAIFWNSAILTGPITLVSVFISFQSLFVLVISTFLSSKYPLLVSEAIDIKTIGLKVVAILLMGVGLLLLTF